METGDSKNNGGHTEFPAAIIRMPNWNADMDFKTCFCSFDRSPNLFLFLAFLEQTFVTAYLFDAYFMFFIM